MSKITEWVKIAKPYNNVQQPSSYSVSPVQKKGRVVKRVSEVNITRQEIRSEAAGAGSMQGTAARPAALAALLAAVLSLQITKTNADGNFLTTKGRKLTRLLHQYSLAVDLQSFCKFQVSLSIKVIKKRSSS